MKASHASPVIKVILSFGTQQVGIGKPTKAARPASRSS